MVRLSPEIAELNRTLLIEAEVPNEKGALRPGSFAMADVVVQADQQIVTVPALGRRGQFAGVEKVHQREGRQERGAARANGPPPG